MNRGLLAAVISAAAACAVSAVLPVAAHATARSEITTYTERSSVSFKGVGSLDGQFVISTGSEKVVLSPRLAVASDWAISVSVGTGHNNESGQVDIIGDHAYARTGNGAWSEKTLSASQFATDVQGFNPYVTLAKFAVLPGVRRVGTGHYTVTATTAQLGSFTSWEFSETVASFAHLGVKTLTISVWLDGTGRPVRITATGQSSTELCTITETFANYNHPLTVTAP
jgi:hypothetical protein